MDDIVELELTKAVNATNTNFIRDAVRDRIKREGLQGPPVELMRFHVFILCTSGTGVHMVDFEDHIMTPGMAMWIRPGQVQRWSNTDDGFHAEVAVFRPSSVPDLPLFDHLLGTTGIVQFREDALQLEQQMEWMAADLERNQDFAMAAAVMGVILRLFSRHAGMVEGANDKPNRKLARAFVDSIDANVTERSVTWHAQRIGASTRTVARATTETLGQRPKQVIDARVILEAQRLLAWSTEDVTTIARRLNFSEASNFTKFFRNRTGTSPSDFRTDVIALGVA